MIRHYLVCLPYWIFVDYIFVRLSLTYLPANNLRRISTMYVRGYLQGREKGRVVTRMAEQLRLNIWYTRRRQTTRQHKTTCFGHHYTRANTNNVNKTCVLLQTTGKHNTTCVGYHHTHANTNNVNKTCVLLQTTGKHNTTCVGHHSTHTNTNNVNKTCVLLQTTGKHNTTCVGHHYMHTNTNNVNKICVLLQKKPGQSCYIIDDKCYKLHYRNVSSGKRSTKYIYIVLCHLPPIC